MKTNTHLCLLHFSQAVIACLLFLSPAHAQQRGKLPSLPSHMILLRGGVLKGSANVSSSTLTVDTFRTVHYKKNYYTILQFDKLPGTEDKAALTALGYRLYDYLPNNAYLAEVPEDFTTEDLKRYAVSGAYPMPANFKIAASLLGDDAPALTTGQLIGVSFFGSLTREEVQKELEAAGASIVSTKIQPSHTLFINAGTAAIQKIAALPFISYVGIQPMKDLPLNYNNRAAHGVDAVATSSGRNLQGDGVTLGMGDNSDAYTHVDFTGRLIDRFPASVQGHGLHTTGTAGGGGILDPMYKGMAPHSTIINQYYSDILVNAPTYITDYDMVVTNNSYTDYDNGCIYDGEYDFLANFVDEQLLTYPSLMHDFAAGNDGYLTCSPFPYQYSTIKSGFQSAKNILTVGNLDNSSYIINNTSSCGPTNDGRLKPEVVAGGTNIISTFLNDTYIAASGTSMASPTVTGSLVLLYQRYRQLHGNADPSAALIKAVVCNSATDLGNPGPDFVYGFGSINDLASVQTIENNQYYTGTISNSGTNSYTLSNIPAGLQQIKILLYWPDAPAAAYAATALVNNLDLTVTSPDGTTHYPLILNPDPAHVTDNAVEGIDNLNNIEQVVINNPPGGNFTVTINGTSIPSGPQAYAVAYQLIKPSVTLLYPYGTDTWVPGQTEIIRWNAYGGDPNPFTIEYSADNGSTWSTISNSVPYTSRLYSWTVPATATNQGLFRVTRNGTSYSDVSSYNFTVLGQPVITLTNPCQGYASLVWGTIPSATSYDIMCLKGDSMQKIANTTDTTFLQGNLNRDSSYWFAVRSVNGATPGRRSLAANIIPSWGACSLSALNNDLTIDSVIGPFTGRIATSTQLGNAVPLSVEIRNLGTIPTSSPLSLSYQVNGGTIITETSSAIVNASSGTLNYTFTNTYDFSAAGSYTIQVWVNYPGDPLTSNDTITTVIKQLQNTPITLTPSFTEGFETAAAASYTSPIMGFTGLDRCDFSTSNTNGRTRTFVNTGFARTGDRCATLDEIHYNTSYTADSLITTFNLSNYSASDQIWLDFYYKNQGIVFNLPGNQIWIRGNDQAAWIPVCTLDTNAANVGVYQPSPHINITGILTGASPSQAISSSFQVKFGEQGYTSTNSLIPDGDLDNGYSFDDITITRGVNDIGVLALTAPSLSNICNLSNAETVSILVKNYSSTTATNIPVTYSINGSTVTEYISSISPQDSVVYNFTTTANLSAYQSYTLSAWSAYPGDTYHANDTLAPIIFQTTPVISTFPYLEGFESNNGYWYTNGVNDSWQWGTPAKTIINKAANGTKCWVTSLTGDYNNNELSYLYSPCFNLSGLTNPVLSFSHIFQTEDDCDCDYHWAEYSTDDSTWTKLGSVGIGTNWYDNATREAWQLSDTIWHVSSYAIPTNAPKVRFRIVMSSDPATTYEGVAIDDVHIFDNVPVYADSTVSSGITQNVNGNNWVNFDLGGNRIASLNPNGQNLGSTTVKVFFRQAGVQNDGQQYYLKRNIVIQPSNVPTDTVSVRFYFLDSEADSVLDASGCSTCTPLHDAYQSVVTQYSSPVLTEEDSLLSNDSSGTTHYLFPHRDITIIPYDKGYYTEYQVKGFSEFWIGSGPADTSNLPQALLSFTARRNGISGLLQWSTTYEKNTSRYLIEKSRDGANFGLLDSVTALGGNMSVNNYQYNDPHLWAGVDYYRLKMVAKDGSFKYSPVRWIADSATVLKDLNHGAGYGSPNPTPDSPFIVRIFPNPVRNGVLYISSTVNCERIRLTDVSGRTILESDIQGMFNTLPVGNLAKGIYFVSVVTEAGQVMRKVLVE